MARTKSAQALDFKIREEPGPRNRTLGRAMAHKPSLGRAATSHKRARAEHAQSRYERALDNTAPYHPRRMLTAREAFEESLESLARSGMPPECIERLRAAAARERGE